MTTKPWTHPSWKASGGSSKSSGKTAYLPRPPHRRSWKLTTPPSNFEANSNYKDVQDPAITVRFKLTSSVPNVDSDCYICAWTTTPWTLPENLALGVGPEIVYAVVTEKASGDTYIVAKERLSAVWKKKTPTTGSVNFRARNAGATYEPLFPYFADQPTLASWPPILSPATAPASST